ncbi:MAG: sigma-54 dependent transcriptional regulator [Candidatus Krumholzibacteria bacterium]|jgi:DNA-binding NtrC family response regulator|nr:sigma-54 dependent transcriptional regulator [Candidatus Krumholzibacteria bacterium]MDP6668598.1 sigma-54 dependent transcriptional regulator [Candidatus Krumholzibacteria bacterium]MDP6796231.1 sigma-54 dependent transcriptional regulator [Candidatus Krumholzibacteria bacterium]MDP7021334.1 sigma-54 dependent transcriptional regulator [Candidatus Krumholzibacteria bacterium]
MASARILIVDDEAQVRESLARILDYEGHETMEAEDGLSALEILAREDLDLVFLDIKMKGLDGLEVLKEQAKRGLEIPVIVISGHGDVSTAVEATKLGAFDFLEKPLDVDRILLTLRNALEQGTLRRRLEESLHGRFEIIGESPAIREILTLVERVGPSEARVLITGENGSGKELVARAIHLSSRRSAGNFVEVNCAAIPNELIESELFGHEKGSFTGAHQRRIGKFEQATGGTLFLDEIGDMSLDAQAKVLRVLQEGRLERVGGTETLEVNVRVIAATNKNLLEEAREKLFREDLYYRLNVVPLVLPPLRERREDIPLLVEHFLSRFCSEMGCAVREVTAKAMERLKMHPWPGNVRELQNLVERLLILLPDDPIDAGDIPLLAGDKDPSDFMQAESFQDFKEQSESAFLAGRIRDCGGNVSKAARSLGIQRSHLYRKIEKYKLHKDIR